MNLLNEYFSWNLRHHGRDQTDRLLSDDELDALFDAMDQDGLPEAAMTLEQADGYLTALAIGPEPVPVHEWMETIFGQPTLPLPHDNARQQRLLALLRARYLDIQLRLDVRGDAVNMDNVFTPLRREVPAGDCITPYRLDERQDRIGDWPLKQWARGFRQAVGEDERWQALLDDPQHYPLLGIVMLFDLGYNPDRPALQIDQDPQLEATLAHAVYDMKRWWRDERRRVIRHPFTDTAVPLASAKIGRNEPCPCGSGKKYKKCCGA